MELKLSITQVEFLTDSKLKFMNVLFYKYMKLCPTKGQVLYKWTT